MAKGTTGKPTKFSSKFPDGDLEHAQKALKEVYDTEAGFVIIVNGDNKQIFARFHNLAADDISFILKELDKQEKKSNIFIPDNKILI